MRGLPRGKVPEMQVALPWGGAARSPRARGERAGAERGERPKTAQIENLRFSFAGVCAEGHFSHGPSLPLAAAPRRARRQRVGLR